MKALKVLQTAERGAGNILKFLETPIDRQAGAALNVAILGGAKKAKPLVQQGVKKAKPIIQQSAKKGSDLLNKARAMHAQRAATHQRVKDFFKRGK